MFVKFPQLKVVMIESGFTWLPAYFWRADKTWRGVRSEVPWLDRPAVGTRARPRAVSRFSPPTNRRIRSSSRACSSRSVRTTLLLFSTDYPHYHYEGEDVIPAGIPPELLRKILVDNALATYPRLAN